MAANPGIQSGRKADRAETEALAVTNTRAFALINMAISDSLVAADPTYEPRRLKTPYWIVNVTAAECCRTPLLAVTLRL